jgi:hypothetical protein
MAYPAPKAAVLLSMDVQHGCQMYRVKRGSWMSAGKLGYKPVKERLPR